MEPPVSQRALEPSAEEKMLSSCEVCVVQIALRNILPFWEGGRSFIVWPNLGSLSCDPPGKGWIQIHPLTAGGSDVPGPVLTSLILKHLLSVQNTAIDVFSIKTSSCTWRPDVIVVRMIWANMGLEEMLIHLPQRC